MKQSLSPHLTAKSLLDILIYRAQYQSDKQAYIFLENGETESESLTYGELDRQAREIAAHLQSWQGERALLLYPSGLEFITAFFGCLYAGVIAVPIYPPKRNQKLSRLLSIVHDASAKIALTTTSIRADFEKSWEDEAELAQLKLITTDTIEAKTQEFVPKSVTPETLAFLQYTSGSTGIPKGVMVSHENILYNQEMIQRGFQHTKETIVVGWLPLFHDMGLIGNVLQPMYLGIPSYLLSPMTFLQQPYLWLKAISHYKATTSGGPDFAYSLCVRKITPEQRANLDLSSWQVAFNGSEPVRPETLKQFAATFASCGFRQQMFYPCYGMAEATLFITGGKKTESPVVMHVNKTALEQNQVVVITDNLQESKEIVSCGQAWLDEKVIIVDPNSFLQCPSNQVGEIWVSGKHITQGYWNQPELTKTFFQAHLSNTGSFLRTGDLGFIVDGELFITGRLKDLIIIRGRNYYPQDIELTLQQSHPALQPTCGAAFSVETDGEEQLVVVQEVERSHRHDLDVETVFKSIRQELSEHHDIQPYAIVLIKFATIAKTSSGKVQRYICRNNFLTGSLEIIGQWFKPSPEVSEESQQVIQSEPTAEVIQTWFINCLADYINIPPEEIDIEEPLTIYGLDSSVVVTITEKLANWLNLLDLSPVIFWKYPNIRTLAEYLVQEYQEQHGSN